MVEQYTPFFYKNVVFPAQADFRLKIFLYYS